MFELLRPRLPRLLLAILFGVLSLGSALALAAVSAWLITRAWQMPPVLDLTIAVVAVRALGISRGVMGYCERLASHDTALRAGADVRERLYSRLASGPVDAVMRRHTGELVSGIGSSVDDLSDVLVRAVVPISVAAILGLAATVAVAVISPAAAGDTGGMPPGCGRHRAVAWPPGPRWQQNTWRHSIIHSGTPPRCSRSSMRPNCGSVAASMAYSKTPTGSNATGATQSTGRRHPLHWRRLLRRLRSAPVCSAPSSAVSHWHRPSRRPRWRS